MQPENPFKLVNALIRQSLTVLVALVGAFIFLEEKLYGIKKSFCLL